MVVNKAQTPFAPARFNSATGEMELSEMAYSDIDLLDSIYTQTVKEKYHPAGTTFRSNITHETGHGITNKIAVKYNVDMIRLCTAIQEKVLNELKLTENDIPNHLCGYATEKDKYGHQPAEFVAEAFAEYMDSPSPRPIAQRVGIILKSMLAGGKQQ